MSDNLNKGIYGDKTVNENPDKQFVLLFDSIYLITNCSQGNGVCITKIYDDKKHDNKIAKSTNASKLKLESLLYSLSTSSTTITNTEFETAVNQTMTITFKDKSFELDTDINNLLCKNNTGNTGNKGGNRKSRRNRRMAQKRSKTVKNRENA